MLKLVKSKEHRTCTVTERKRKQLKCMVASRKLLQTEKIDFIFKFQLDLAYKVQIISV